VPRKSTESWLDAIEISATIVLVIFAVFYLNMFFGGTLNRFGIVPRTARGLVGILFSPLLHANYAHLTANAVSLFFLLVVVFAHREYKAETALVSIWLASGFGTWLIGRPWNPNYHTVHIGASSIIYGLVVYVVASGWWLRSWQSAFWAILILFMYGGIVYGMFPQRGIISWEGHLSGAIAGWLVAARQHR
jgi:membrane associated rhomboid family serine protease